ncbi:MAG: FAD-dependent oxidoreductase [Eubacteriales bacterium]|nr:FAD-dependent oxidoreductase [Eubacteriales bacterium]
MKLGTTTGSQEYLYDVVVIGGGTTGVCAAIAAAREGAKTALVEKNGFLGGNAACGLPWLGFHNYLTREFVVKGIPLEIIRKLQADEAATEFVLDPICSSAVGVNPSMLKIVLAEIVLKEGIDVYLHSIACEAETAVHAPSGADGKVLGSLAIVNKQGKQYIKSKIFIDCTDTADVAVICGEDHIRGRSSDNKVQVASHIFTIGNVDTNVLIKYFEENPGQIRPFPLGINEMKTMLTNLRKAPLFIIGAFPDLVRQAAAEGLDIGRERMIGSVNPSAGEMMLVTSRIEDADPNDIRNITKAELEGIIKIRDIMRFVREYMPGGENARIVMSGHQAGIRESRHIRGKYYLTGKDLVEGKVFCDSIARGAYHIDVHSPDHKGLETEKPKEYTIPYRSLLPAKTANLIIAGRCISADHMAMASTRVIPISAAMGQAAGTAAAAAAEKGCTPYNLYTDKGSFDKLREKLKNNNAVY